MPKMLLRLKAAGGAAVALKRFDGVVKGALHLGVKLFVLELFAGNPLGGGYQRGLFFEVAHIPIARGFFRRGAVAFNGHDGVQHIKRGQGGVSGLQGYECGVGRAAGLGIQAQGLRHERHGGGCGHHGI